MPVHRPPTRALTKHARLTASLLALSGLLLAGTTPIHASDSVDHGAAPSGNITVVARFSSAQPSGIARLPDGRIVLSFPTSAQTHPGPVLAIWHGGTTLTPFPDAPSQKLMKSPLGMTVDAAGHLWVIDEGATAGQTEPQTPAILLIDPASNRILRRFTFAAPAVRPDSHLNDIRVDLTHGRAGTAFISDTSQTTHPALIALDIASGEARRLLADDPTVSAAPGHVTEFDGKLFRYNPDHAAMPQGGVNGIGLSRDSSRLYWSPFSSRRLYSAPTTTLADPAATDATIRKAIHDEGEVGVVDGIFTGPDDSLYMADEERHGITRRAPDGTLTLVAHDPRLIAPDSIAPASPATDRLDSLFLTVGQWSRLPAFHDGKDMQERPYILVRISLTGK
ncbi:SMP-30/gluconolactonase/LRE family protein [Acetobacter conturbans]|uniref:Gluconolactonase n=1 Tax=Acetobacter conturbans TaxID=1737472 RepID=A0ABX0JZ54_9PROT|nr:L-dopachrome tautomerase-related protein [Acetobacter conturbans]NHN87082.1 gluconolactonase [Acetobacter conturbans]